MGDPVASTDATPPRAVSVRAARPDEVAAVRNVLDGAALSVDHGRLPTAIAAGDVLVAHEGGPILGALLLADTRIEAIAVRRRRRDQGIGRALVAAAAERRPVLTGSCPPAVRPFYESLGFVCRREGSRVRIRLDP